MGRSPLARKEKSSSATNNCQGSSFWSTRPDSNWRRPAGLTASRSYSLLAHRSQLPLPLATRSGSPESPCVSSVCELLGHATLSVDARTCAWVGSERDNYPPIGGSPKSVGGPIDLLSHAPTWRERTASPEGASPTRLPHESPRGSRVGRAGSGPSPPRSNALPAACPPSGASCRLRETLPAHGEHPEQRCAGDQLQEWIGLRQ